MSDVLFEQSEQQGDFLRAHRHYIGRPSTPLALRRGAPDDNVIVSLGRLVVDKGASFLFGDGVHTQVTGPFPEPKQDWLEECWRRNKKHILLLKLATNGGIFGHAFLRLLDTQPYPRVINLDPQTVTVVTDPDDIDSVWKFTLTAKAAHGEADDEELAHRTVITNASGKAGRRVPGGENQWEIIDQQMTGGSWQTTAQVNWPYPFCPIVHCQNLPRPNSFWGESDLPADVLQILDAITTVTSHYNKIIRLHAHPKVWVRGMGSQTIDFSIDSVLALPGETGEIKALEMQSDLSSTMALLDKLLSLLSYMVRIPLVALGEPDSLGSISGVALQIRYQPLIEKTNTKRLTYGDLLIETNRCLLAMAPGRNFGDTTICHLDWPELLPSNALEERQVAVLDESLGIASRESLATKLGYTWTQEQQKLAEEKQTSIELGLTPPPAPAVTPDGETVPPPAPFGGPGTTVTPKLAH